MNIDANLMYRKPEFQNIPQSDSADFTFSWNPCTTLNINAACKDSNVSSVYILISSKLIHLVINWFDNHWYGGGGGVTPFQSCKGSWWFYECLQFYPLISLLVRFVKFIKRLHMVIILVVALILLSLWMTVEMLWSNIRQWSLGVIQGKSTVDDNHKGGVFTITSYTVLTLRTSILAFILLLYM